jgi:hypothetical protein
MNKQQALQWLLKNKDVLKISKIGEKAKVPNLYHIVTGRIDGHGSVYTLADKHVPALVEEIERIAATH